MNKIIISTICFIGIVLISLTETNEKNYDIYNYKSKYLGNSIEIKKPFAYVSGLGECNKIDEQIALNTSCLLSSDSDYKLTELRPSCINCLDKKRLVNPIKLHYKENKVLKVISSFKSQPSKLSYKFFNSTIPYLLLEDENGNKIEIMEIQYELLKDESFDLNSEEKRIKSEHYHHEGSSTEIFKTFCFYEEVLDGSIQMKNIKNLIVDFKIEDSVKVKKYEHCPPARTSGFYLTSTDFNDYLTLRYYLSEWRVYGRWIN